MAGYDNIKDANSNRTPEERRELAKIAGKASGEARRRQADFRKTLNLLLTAEIDNEEYKPILEELGVECTLESALLMAQIKEAMKGNTKAAYFVAQYAGQSDKTINDEREQAAKINLIQAQKDKVHKTEDAADGRNKVKSPYDIIIPKFWDIFDDVEHEHRSVTSGRAGTKQLGVNSEVVMYGKGKKS